jgi:proline iminopeptidase
VPLPIPEPRASGTSQTTTLPLYWVRYGNPSNPPLLLLHGGPGADHRYLLPQMLHLAERYDLILYDQRGSGQSRAETNAPITWHDHVSDLAQLCREFSITKPSIAGYSWGGMLAILYAVAALDNASLPSPARLALISPAPVTREYRVQFDNNLRARGNTPEIVAEREQLMTSGLRESNPEAYRQRIFELGVTGYFADPANAHNLTPFRVIGRVQQSTWDSLGDFDLLAGLTRLGNRPLPAKIIHGRDDPIPTASSIDAAHALKCELVLLDECGHVPYVERPAELWRALDPFLASTDAIAG